MRLTDTKAERAHSTKPEGWNRPPVIETDGEGELLEVGHGAASSLDARRLPHGRGAGRRARGATEAGLRLSAPQSRKDCAKGQTYLASMPYTDRLDYILLAHQQLGLRAGGGEAGRAGGSGARGVSARDPRRAHASTESCIDDRLSAAGDGRERHSADVCLSRARKDSRSVREPDRLAHDVQLHALRRLPRGCLGSVAGCNAQGGGGSAGVCR